MRTLTDSLAVVALMALAMGCGAKQPPAPEGPTNEAEQGCSELLRGHDGPRLLDVEWPRSDRPPTLTGHSGAAPAPGERFVLLSPAGYLGTLEVTAEEHFECYDDCPAFWSPTRWKKGSVVEEAHTHAIDPSKRTYALGLVPKDPTRIRVQPSSPSDPPLPPGWSQSLSIDLDGDGQSDIVLVHRKCDCGTLTEMKMRAGQKWTVRDRDFFRSVFTLHGPMPCDG